MITALHFRARLPYYAPTARLFPDKTGGEVVGDGAIAVAASTVRHSGAI